MTEPNKRTVDLLKGAMRQESERAMTTTNSNRELERFRGHVSHWGALASGRPSRTAAASDRGPFSRSRPPPELPWWQASS